MAEPLPAYPVPDPEPNATVAGSAEPSFEDQPSRRREAFYQTACFRTGRVYSQARNGARDVLDAVTRTARYMADERPVHLVIGVAAAAFVVGSALRIWRNNHE